MTYLGDLICCRALKAPYTYPHSNTHTHTHTRMHTFIQLVTHTHQPPHTRTHTRMQAHTHTHIHTPYRHVPKDEIKCPSPLHALLPELESISGHQPNSDQIFPSGQLAHHLCHSNEQLRVVLCPFWVWKRISLSLNDSFLSCKQFTLVYMSLLQTPCF